MSSVPIESNSKLFMKRKAVYSSGRLGSLYDQSQDRIFENSNGKRRRKTNDMLETGRCKLIRGKTIDSEPLLQMIGVQDDMRLSILLNLVPKTKLTSIVDYSLPINEYTRFLHYAYIRKSHNLHDNERKTIIKQIQSSQYPHAATHFIANVHWGFEFVVVLQLPNMNETTEQIDNVLNRIDSSLNGPKSNVFFKLTPNEENILQGIINTKIYSCISDLATKTTIRDIYHSISQLQRNKTVHQPIDFELHPIQKVVLMGNSNDRMSSSRCATCKKDIEQYLLQLLNSINDVKSWLTPIVSNTLHEHLKEQHDEINMKLSEVEKKYRDEIERWTKLVTDLRKNEIQISQLEEALKSEQQQAIKRDIRELVDNIKQLETKVQLINDLQQKKFQYYKVTKDNTQKLAEKLIKDDQVDRVLCSNDKLNKDKSSEFEQLRNKLIEEHQNNSNLRLIYADFSYSSFNLPDTIIFPKDKINHTEDTVINILLLGESGVGKSTFINAFVNYLKFETLKDAESSEPVVLIPVSFMITAGDNFDEHILKFGDLDESKNEDFDHPGQSVTQRCKSYVFDLKGSHGKKLRIIDTPGFGDTRGLDQDDLNMQHILEYINNLTHMHAVCFLLKPNASRLTNFFRICLTQLCDLLSSNARQNIIFCFTNARTTFYTPGDTAPLLRTLLNSFPEKDIPFAKKNTFCFDNESFRYLVALQNSIKFNELDRSEYEKSWSISVKESNRLLNYISNDLSMYRIDEPWKSIKHIQIKIVHMIRPILEAMRNTLRNIISWNNDEKRKSIVLSPAVIKRPTSVCLSCEHHTTQFNRFSISVDSPHEYLGKDHTSKCVLNQQIPLDYILKYKISNTPANYNIQDIKDQVELLLNACIEFGQFLINTDYSSKANDPFQIGLKRMIDDEKKICSNNDSELLNGQLLTELRRLKKNYKKKMNEIQSNRNHIDLIDIYKRIQTIRNYSSIREQMTAVEQGQRNLMKDSVYEVPSSLTNTSDVEATYF